MSIVSDFIIGALYIILNVLHVAALKTGYNFLASAMFVRRLLSDIANL